MESEFFRIIGISADPSAKTLKHSKNKVRKVLAFEFSRFYVVSAFVGHLAKMMTEVEDRFLRIGQIQDRYSVCDRTIDRWLADPSVNFPQPVVIQRRRYWRLADLERFERERGAGKSPKAA